MTRKKTIYNDPEGMVLKIHAIVSPQMIRIEQYDCGVDGGLSDTISLRGPARASALSREIDAWVNGQFFSIRQATYTAIGDTSFRIKTPGEHIVIPDKTGAKKISAYLRKWAADNG